MEKMSVYNNSWSIALYGLTILFGIAAVLNILQMHIIFLTTHAADISGPALLYIQTRKLYQQGSRRFPAGIFGRSPEIAAGSFFFASVITEISQIYYPHGIFSGRFDPLDIAAYAFGIGVCYSFEKFGLGMIKGKSQ